MRQRLDVPEPLPTPVPAGRRAHPAIDRPRLLEVLAGRFDRRLTLVTAGPGFGKTTLVARAIADNALRPCGDDVWLQCRVEHSEADELARALRSALGLEDEPGLEGVTDAVWSRAPTDVVLALDDVHEIAEGSTGEDALAQLVDTLPTNGHLMLVGRRAPEGMNTARLRLAGDLAVVVESDLAFDDEELARFAASRDIDVGLLATVRWPALAELVVTAGHDAALEYLWEEVLAQIDDEQLAAITLLSPFPTVDDALVRAVTGSDRTADELLGDLPLNVRTPEGALQLHSMWGPVLRRRLDRSTEVHVLKSAASHFLQLDDVRRAFDSSSAADDLDGQRAAVRAAMAKPLAQTRVRDLHYLADRLPSCPELDVETALLRAFLALEGSETVAFAQFETAAALARTRGDTELECIALWRLYQSALWGDGADRVAPIIARSQELASSGATLAQVLVEIETSIEHGRRGRRDDALALLHAVEQHGRDEILAQTADLRRGVLFDLGCPEEIGPPAPAPGDEAIDAPRSLVETHAAWLRGDAPPEVAVPVVEEVTESIDELRLAHQRVAVSGVVALIAVHAGDLAMADELIELGRRYVGHVGAGHAANFLRVAEATSAATRHDEAAATTQLEAALAVVPIDILPARSYLNSLPLLHALVPQVRAAIDAATLGPSLTIVQRIARALTSLREHGDIAQAASLPWRNVNLMRVHLIPPHAAELAVAAIVGGAREAEAVLQQLPEPRDQMRWVAARHDGAVGDFARERLLTLPIRPRHVVRVELLGGCDLLRDGVAVLDKEWKRERVRQIMCYLLARPRVTRTELTDALWPDLDERSASANLRTNLGHLRRLLEPEREHGEAPWFVRGDAETLSLWRDGIESDVEQFDSLVGEGRRLEERGVTGSALERFLAAAALYRGDYAAGLDGSWLTYERIRLRSAYVMCSSRAGELLLARGEPELALGAADDVVAADELAERAHRLRIRSLLALGDRSAARASGERVLEVLRAARLSPEIETTRLLEPLGLLP